MGSFIEINDTLQLTDEQGFPKELDYQKHVQKQYKAEDFKDKVFAFRDKPKIRIYKAPPVRNFLAQNINGKWLYWGLIHILEITHDYSRQTTSGKYKIIAIYSPDEMKHAQAIIDCDQENDFFQ